MLAVSILILLVLIACGLPLFFAIGISSASYFRMAGINLALMTQRMSAAIDSFLIPAIPFFFLAGELMNACTLTDRIINLSRALVGHIDGGLAQVDIFASLIFSGLSGSPTADTIALGSVPIPAMKREGYPARFRRRALVTTMTEEAAMAPAASMGDNMGPPNGASIPAATGISTTL